MIKFKIGDKVVCVDADFYDCITEGNIYTIIELDDDFIRFNSDKGSICGMFHFRFELAPEEITAPKTTPHIHKKEIIAWVYGAEIEYEFYKDYWVPCPSDPKWLRHVKYRVKPAKTPTQIAIGEKEIELVKLKQQDLVERGIAEVLK